MKKIAVVFASLLALVLLAVTCGGKEKAISLKWKLDTRKTPPLFIVQATVKTIRTPKGGKPETSQNSLKRFITIGSKFEFCILPLAEFETFENKNVSIDPLDTMTLLSNGSFQELQENFLPEFEEFLFIGLLFTLPKNNITPGKVLEEKWIIPVVNDPMAIGMAGTLTFTSKGFEKQNGRNYLKIEKKISISSLKGKDPNKALSIVWSGTGTSLVDTELGQVVEADFVLESIQKDSAATVKRQYKMTMKKRTGQRKTKPVNPELGKLIKKIRKAVMDNNLNNCLKDLAPDYFTNFELQFPQQRKQKYDDKLTVFANAFLNERNKLIEIIRIDWQLVRRDQAVYAMIANVDTGRHQKTIVYFATFKKIKSAWKITELLGTHRKLVELHLGSGETHDVEPK